MDEVLNPNITKILENEKQNLEKDNILKTSSMDKKGYSIYDKLSKL